MNKFLSTIFLAITLAGCTASMHEPEPQAQQIEYSDDWRIHCETAKSQAYSMDEVGAPGARNARWLWMKDRLGNDIKINGQLQDGFLVVEGITRLDGTPIVYPKPSADAVRQACLFTLGKFHSEETLELGLVRAARPREKVNVSMVFPADRNPDRTVQRVVIFGDSLSDTGLLKRRLRVFPQPPYWLGRFSNGPIWVDYLEAYTDLALQNHSYGGAAISRHEKLPGEKLIDRIKLNGQYFVSGTIAIQIEDYINKSLQGGSLQAPEETAFIVWAGANDYISKEPVSGVISTFLNSPEGEFGYKSVVDLAIVALTGQLKSLYAAGARKIMVINLPDLGLSPIVLQNETYLPQDKKLSDVSRRLQMAHRLSDLTAYHNDSLAAMLAQLQRELPSAQIVLQDANQLFGFVLTGQSPIAESTPFEYGFTLADQRELLSDGAERKNLHRPCYSGRYLGSKDGETVCANQSNALFWDNVHPTSFTHCWQSWFVANTMYKAGWLANLPDLDSHRAWCGRVAQRADGVEDTVWVLSNEHPAPVAPATKD